MTTATAQSKMTLPAAGEVKAAVQGQRALAAYLATQFETQHIQIFDDHKQAHQVELPTSALRLLVDILADSTPANDESYYLHYCHPNTFESEVLRSKGLTIKTCGCLFSAGYSAGWCSDAFQVEVHGREVRCLSRGDAACEFIMAPSARLDEYEARLRSGWS